MTERTPLRSATAQQYDPQYVFNTGRVYRNKVRQCQCCVCATVLACFVIAIVATVGYSVNTDTADTGSNATNNTVLASLLLVQFPLPESSNASWDASAALIEEAMNIGEAGLRDRDKQEQSGPRLDKNSPSYRHQMAVRTTPEATRLARAGYVMNVATRHLAASGVRAVGQGPTVQADWIPPEACADEATPCPVLPYRSADGSCNNPHHPHKWGVAMRPFRRTLPPDYADVKHTRAEARKME